LYSARNLSALILVLAFAGSATGTDFYVSPAGSHSGTGSIQSPWDLTYALNAPAAVKPGDTIWLRGGVYNAAADGYTAYHSKLNGTSTAPVIVRQYPGERAIIDGVNSGAKTPALRVDGAWSWFWGFEITTSQPTRSINEGRNHAIEVYGPNTKLINLTIYDNGQGIGFWDQAVDSEAYGNLIFNNGWIAQDRGHGHGIYTQNSTGLKKFRDNIILSQFGYNVQIYGSAAMSNFLFDGNVFFGGPSIFGGQVGLANLTISNSKSYDAFLEVGQPIDNTGLSVINNYLAGGLIMRWWKNASVSGLTLFPVHQDVMSTNTEVDLRGTGSASDYKINNNAYYQGVARGGFDFIFQDSRGAIKNNTFSTWRSSYGFDLNSTYTAGAPTGLKYFLSPNQYEPGLSTLIIYNWGRQSSASISLTGIGLNTGDVVEVRNAFDYLRESTLITYTGTPVSIPMTGWSIATPLGYTQKLWSSPFPEFAIFTLRKLPPGTAINVSPQMATLKAAQQQQLVATVGGNTNKSVVWSVSPAMGTISSSGLYTAPSSIAAVTSVTVTAKSAADPTKSDSCVIKLLPNITVTLNPTSAILGPGSTQLFTPVVTGTPDDSVIWSMNPTTLGTLSTTGRYTAPSTIKTQQTVTITATSAVDTTKSDSTVVTLAPGVGVTITPPSATLNPGGTAQFAAKVTGTTNTAVTWSRSPAVGTISTSGLFTAPSSVSSTTDVVVKATSVADSSRYSTSLVTIKGLAGVSVSVTPSTAAVLVGGTAQFAAQVTGATNTSVTWSLSPAVGTISSAGLYKAPSAISTSTAVTVKATSVADSTRYDTAIVTVSPTGTISVSVTPATASLLPGGTIQFAAQVTGTTNTGVTWSRSSTIGTISSSGLYTAPSSISSVTTVTVKATSNADTTKYGTAIVTISPTGTISVLVTPGTASLAPGGTVQFTAQVTGTTNKAVTWSRSSSIGSISSTGLYTAPSSVAIVTTVTIKATSNADSTKYDTYIVTISQGGSSSVSGAAGTASLFPVVCSTAGILHLYSTIDMED
jgi:hypothetical protein